MASNPWARRDRGHCVSYRRRSGVAFRGGNLADYFVKLAREITSSTTKNSRAGRSPFAVLRDGLTTGFLDDLELWRDWERASKGRRQVTWSLGDHDLRTLAGLDPEQSDEEIAAEEVLHGDDALALPHETWTALR